MAQPLVVRKTERVDVHRRLDSLLLGGGGALLPSHHFSHRGFRGCQRDPFLRRVPTLNPLGPTGLESFPMNIEMLHME